MGTHGLQLSDAAMESAAAIGIELRHYYSCRRRPRHHSVAGRHENPTIYKPETQIRGSPTLPPPRRPAEREGTDGLAGGETRERRLLLFASREHCSGERRRGKQHLLCLVSRDKTTNNPLYIIFYCYI
jgi:hypothetical protein